MDHKLTLESLHSYLVKHFASEALIDAKEDWPDCHASGSDVPVADPEVPCPDTEMEEVEIEEPNSLFHRFSPPATSLPFVTVCATPEELAIGIERLERIKQRDLDGLLRTAVPRPASEWQEAMLVTSPDLLPYTLFGPQDTAPTRSRSVSLPAPIEPYHHLTGHDDDGPGSTLADAPGHDDDCPLGNELFAVGPTRCLEEATATIYSMRDPAFFNPVQGVQGGYRWALGTSRGSAGSKVRQRFRDDSQWCQPASISALEEITAFTEKRFLPQPEEVNLDDTPLAISQGFATGSLFRLLIAEQPPDMMTYWHGSNLYSITSLYMQGPANHVPSNGPSGVYCFSDARANKVVHYCHYVLSGSGRAWATFAQFAILASQTKKFATDQHYAQAKDITLTAIWFHAVPQDQFVAEYIWPIWDASLEIWCTD